MSQQGFTVHTVPGAGSGNNQPYYSPSPPPQEAGRQKQQKSPQQELAEEETNTRISSPKRQMSLGLTEKYTGLASNIIQITTTMYAFVQICLGLHDTTLAINGPFKGLFIVIREQSIYVIIGLSIGIGAQLFLQAGCQKISKRWKQEHITQHQDQRLGILKVAFSERVGLFFTSIGFIIDGLSDISFVFAFHIPWYVCFCFGLVMNGLSTYAFYDGDERFHAAYMVWWRLETAKKAWMIATIEKARLRNGLTKDGNGFASQNRP